jgi:hypothetical protein
MKIKVPFHSFMERPQRSARTYDSAFSATSPLETDSATPLANELLLGPRNQIEPRLLLADSIDKITHTDISGEQQAIIEGIIRDDAESLAARILPLPAARALDLPVRGDDGRLWRTNAKPASTEEHVPPTLPDIILLARAYDVTSDPKIADALRYILSSQPPTFSHELEVALNNASRRGTSVMDEYQNLIALQDTRINRPTDPRDVQMLLDMRMETPPEYRQPSAEDKMGHTKFVGR